MTEWFIKAKTLFASSSQCNSVIISALVGGTTLRGFMTTCRCDRCPDCCCGQDSAIGLMHLPTFWTIISTSSNIFQSSADAQGVANLVSLISPMDVYQRKGHISDGSTMLMLCNPFTMYSS